jgi:hypothetical protein
MSLFKITVKQSGTSNGVRLEKGMSVQVVSKYSTNPMTINGGQEVQDAFMRTFGVDLRKYGGGGISNLSHKMDVEKI